MMVSVILLIFTIRANSQFVAGGNIALGIPVGDFRAVNTFGFGLDLYGGYCFYDDKMQAGIDLGYLYLSGQETIYVDGTSSKLTNHLVPLALYYSYGMPLGQFKPYVRLDAGVYFSTLHSAYGSYGTKVKFGIAPAIGSEFAINDRLNVFMAVEMNIVSKENFIGINIGTAYKIDFFK